MDKISPAVITSRVAKEHFQMIQNKHADLVVGIANQAEKVKQYNLEKEQRMQEGAQIKAEQDKQARAEQVQAQKEQMTFAQKQAELDIKRAALTAD